MLFSSLFAKTAEYEKLAHALSAPGACALFGLPGSGRAMVYAALAKETGRFLCIVTPGEAEATRFAGDLNALGIPTAVFPARDYVLRPIEGTAREYEYRRLSVLGDIVGGRLQAVCVPDEGLTQYTTPRAEFCNNTRTLHPGDTVPRTELTALLYNAGYARRAQVDGPGQFSIRGDIVDLYAPDMKLPVRMEFWGDEIDTMHTFDLATQRREDPIEKIYVSPAREVLFGSPAEAAELLRAFIKKFRGKKRTALEACLATELAQLDGGALPVNMDKYLAVRYPQPATLLDYFDDPLLVLEEPASLREAERATTYRRGEEISALLQDGVLAAGLDNLYAENGYLWAQAANHRTICAENFARSMPDIPLKDIVNAPAHTLPAWGGEVTSLLEDLQPLCNGGAAVTVLAGTQRAAAGLAADLRTKGLLVTTDPDAAPGAGLVQVLPGQLSAGCSVPFAKYALFTARAFGISSTQKKKKRNKDALNSLSEIAVGDLVVHQNHGIGRYAGIQRMAVQGVTKDYLRIEYDKKDVLYVPVTQLDLLSRYTAPNDSDNVKLSRLGGSDWAKTRKKVKAATEQMAKELIELYARRKQAKGHAFPPDDTWQGDFEQRFAYDETPDQLTCAADIKHDMEEPWPMDRLLCGDVGFGKTEVALRAAFKCVDSGRQVMVLCPTTILAQQHYETFFERFAPFGLEVEVLSRFRTPAQQKRALKAFAEGTIDVLIGTHRLLSADVNPKNLGLVIIDEEQRFGVQHKEQLKNLREQIDVLTLSATPIPRTMQMATSGVRDMSLITTPPTGRRPVIVHVGEYDPDVVSAAIRLEVGRGGQVYYVSNRVKTIDDAVARVHEAAPEARVGVAHGKMSPREVEDVMIEFATKKIDVLIATTIVESGIDNACANTLIIEDSQRLGLAQLYQLKGRVGRSATQAYAYFMFPGELPLTEEATARLTALSEFQDLGSGMRIAMRDLEIRGAGSLMGAEQHGNLSSVGFDLFTQMLGQAVAEARGDDDAGVEAASVGINLPADYFLSEEYLPAVDQRVLVYRRLAAAEDLESIDEVQEETEAAHGELPLAGLNLFNRARIRIRGERLGLESVTLSGGRITFLGVDVPKKVAFELKTRYGAVSFPKSRKLSVPYKAGAGAGSGLGRGLDANDGTGPVAAALMLLQQLGASDDD